VATRFTTPALLNHSVRCYLRGVMHGTAHGIAFDDELYYVAALLHDIGLADAFDSHRLPFEEAGGQLAWVFGVAAGWPAGRAARVPEIIVLHMRDDVAPASDPRPTCCRSPRAGK
jgi:HD superfamily phosphodiesterase